MVLLIFVKKQFRNFNGARQELTYVLKKEIMKLILCVKWKKRLKKFGKDMGEINKSKMRQNWSFFALTTVKTTQLRAKKLIYVYIKAQINNLRRKVLIFYSHVKKVQRTLKDVLITRYSKVECLQTYWDKTLAKIQLQATLQNDKDVNEICKQIFMVPKSSQY